jgi:Mrp family chromosome partitioning ATPase
MSEYFRVLKRIETEQRDGWTPPAAGAATPALGARSGSPVSLAVPANLRAAATPLSARAKAGFRQLFDNIRVLENTGTARVLVFAGVTDEEPLRDVTAGLAAYVAQLGIEVLVAELADWHGRPILRRRTVASVEPVGTGDSMPLDLGAPAAQVEIKDWLEGAGRIADLVLIEGRPLSASVDAALLARACGGLVIVAQSELTYRDTLHAAAERAREAGCRTLGVVMYGAHRRVPGWLNRLVGRRRPHRPSLEK